MARTWRQSAGFIVTMCAIFGLWFATCLASYGLGYYHGILLPRMPSDATQIEIDPDADLRHSAPNR